MRKSKCIVILTRLFFVRSSPTTLGIDDDEMAKKKPSILNLGFRALVQPIPVDIEPPGGAFSRMVFGTGAESCAEIMASEENVGAHWQRDMT